MATLPADRTKLALAQANQVPSAVASAQRNIDTLTEAYDTIDLLNQKVDTHANATPLPHADGSVTTAKLANSAVTTPKIADLAVTAAKVANQTLTADKFVPGALTNETQNALRITALEADFTNMVSFGVSPSNSAAKNTIAMQNALNKKGYVFLTKPGTYMINDTLLIGDNTHLHLGEGVIIKQDSSVMQNMLRNSDPVNGNENIQISGGEWDYNDVGQTQIDPHQLHCIVLQKIDRLKVNYVKVLNTHKFCWLIADSQNITIDGLDFDTYSDGLHLHGPIEDAYINNIKGKTGDDMISLTLGDYDSYELSIGNMKKIRIGNIFCDDTQEPILMAGKPGYYFDEITIENIYGTVSAGNVISVRRDLVLNYTRVKNLTIRDIHCTPASNQQFYFECDADNIQISNIDSCAPTCTLLEVALNSNIKKLSLMNVDVVDNEALFPNITILGTIDRLTLDKYDITRVSGSPRGLLQVGTTGVINELRLNDVTQRNGNTFIDNMGILKRIFLTNFDVQGVELFIYDRSSNTDLTTYHMQNGFVQFTSHLFQSEGGNLRLFADGVVCPDNNALEMILTSGSGTVSLNGVNFRISDIWHLTPVEGDMVYHANSSSGFGSGVGLYIYDTSAWRKL